MRHHHPNITPPPRSLSDEPILIDGLAGATLIFFWQFRNSGVFYLHRRPASDFPELVPLNNSGVHMLRPARLAFRSLLVLAAVFMANSPAEQPAGTDVSANEALTSGFREVRIRKLHLVRPDLILYPLAYEVVC